MRSFGHIHKITRLSPHVTVFIMCIEVCNATWQPADKTRVRVRKAVAYAISEISRVDIVCMKIKKWNNWLHFKYSPSAAMKFYF